MVSYRGSVAKYACWVFALEASSCSLAAWKQSKKICCRLERSAGFHSRRSRVGTLQSAPCLRGNASQSCETNEQKLWDCSNIYFSQTLCAHNENTSIVLLPTLHFLQWDFMRGMCMGHMVKSPRLIDWTDRILVILNPRNWVLCGSVDQWTLPTNTLPKAQSVEWSSTNATGKTKPMESATEHMKCTTGGGLPVCRVVFVSYVRELHQQPCF